MVETFFLTPPAGHDFSSKDHNTSARISFSGPNSSVAYTSFALL